MHGFQWLLLAATTVEIPILVLVVYANMHDGQDLKHPLDQRELVNVDEEAFLQWNKLQNRRIQCDKVPGGKVQSDQETK